MAPINHQQLEKIFKNYWKKQLGGFEKIGPRAKNQACIF